MKFFDNASRWLCGSVAALGIIGQAWALEPAELGLIINRSDPVSVRVGAYYQARRRIPGDAVISVTFPTGRAVMSPQVFREVQAEMARALPPRVQVLALAWTFPFRVGCMSVTTAFAAGFDRAFCAKGCLATRASPYFDSPTPKPYRDHRWRPAMLLAGSDEASVRALIDRGVASDATKPSGTGYLVSTSDRNRNVRARYYPLVQRVSGSRFALERVDADALVGRRDVMFYITGRAQVKSLDTNRFLPGAAADHLTSAGGNLRGTKQMSVLRWLDAGATGTYGAVVEPCNFRQKFPNPEVLIRRYLDGDTLIEAYWKSVAWPGQGLFVGEPLARPFGAARR